MSVDVLWAIVALLALAGWAATIILVMRSALITANALGALHKIDTLIDDRIARVVERIRQKRETPVAVPSRPEPTGNAAADALRDIFGGPPLDMLDEQPDSGLEVVS